MAPDFKGLASFVVAGIIAIVICVGYGGYLGVRAIFFPRKTEIVSKTILVPEIRLKTDGKKVDTFYVYRKK